MRLLSILIRILIRSMILGYQLFLSPLLPGACRYHPTCSQYGLEAVDRFGGLRGVWLALKRVGRCHPWGGAGFDPVPTDATIERSGSHNSCRAHSQ